MKIALNVEIDIPGENIWYMESALLESPCIRYWARPVRDNTGTIVCHAVDGHAYPLPENWVAAGLEFLIRRDPPYYRLPELLQGHYDAESLDVLVQAALFKDIVYG